MLLLINLIILNSCTLFIDTIKVEVPKDYVGWCYVIPVSDTTTNASSLIDGKYQIDKDGVVLIPASVLNIKKDHVVKVYDADIDISESMRYAGSVYRTKSEDSSKYEFISFYLPSVNERRIKNGTQYWRDKMYEYNSTGDKKFDSLLKAGKIVF